MLPLERLWSEQSRTSVLTVSGAIILVVAAVDWWTKSYVSLGFLYLFPIMFAAAFLPRWLIGLVGVVCAVLALAYVGERLVERPGNEFGRRLSVRVRSRAATVARAA